MEEKPDQMTIGNSASIIEAREEEMLRNISRDGSIAGDLNATGNLGEGSKIKGIGLIYAKIFMISVLFWMC